MEMVRASWLLAQRSSCCHSTANPVRYALWEGIPCFGFIRCQPTWSALQSLTKPCY